MLEVLGAFVLFALTLTAILQVFSGGLRQVQLSEERAQALLLAESLMASASASERVDEVSDGGTQGGYTWQVRVSPFEEHADSAASPDQREAMLPVRLVQIESTVSWGGPDGRSRAVRLATLRVVSAR